MNDEQPATPQPAEPVAWAIFDSQGFYEARDTEDRARAFCERYNSRSLDDPLRPYSYAPLYAATPQQPGASEHVGETNFEGWLSTHQRTPHHIGYSKQDMRDCYWAGYSERAALQSPPAKARPTDDELWDQTLRERDTYCEWADKLAEAISRFIGFDIGEHSSANNPWARAIDMIPAGTLGAHPAAGEATERGSAA